MIPEKWKNSLKKTIKTVNFKSFRINFSLISIIFITIVLALIVNIWTALLYLITCIYYIPEIISDLAKPLIWSIGFFFGAIVVDIGMDKFFPYIQSKTFPTSLSAVVTGLILVLMYKGVKKLKTFRR